MEVSVGGCFILAISLLSGTVMRDFLSINMLARRIKLQLVQMINNISRSIFSAHNVWLGVMIGLFRWPCDNPKVSYRVCVRLRFGLIYCSYAIQTRLCAWPQGQPSGWTNNFGFWAYSHEQTSCTKWLKIYTKRERRNHIHFHTRCSFMHLYAHIYIIRKLFTFTRLENGRQDVIFPELFSTSSPPPLSARQTVSVPRHALSWFTGMTNMKRDR